MLYNYKIDCFLSHNLAKQLQIHQNNVSNLTLTGHTGLPHWSDVSVSKTPNSSISPHSSVNSLPTHTHTRLLAASTQLELSTRMYKLMMNQTGYSHVEFSHTLLILSQKCNGVIDHLLLGLLLI